MEHPEYTNGVTLSQFSFQIPKPLQENYVRKRPPREKPSHDTSKPLEPSEGTKKKLICLLTHFERRTYSVAILNLIQYFKKYIILSCY